MYNNIILIIIINLMLYVIHSCTYEQKYLLNVLDSHKTGILFQNNIKNTKELNILDYLYYYNGGGVAIGDLNNDNLPDIYFVSNMQENKLYRNDGNFSFTDITKEAGVGGLSTWNSGVVMVDINSDGWLDIYVCSVVGIHGFDGHNELYINNRDGTFTERSAEYGLNIQSYSTSSAFFDFDQDGDLDLYLLNHAIHTPNSFGKPEIREKRDWYSGDKLFLNESGFFREISEEANIYGGINGYGLSVGIADFNLDGWDDIYVANDFHENDYLYINQKDGTFKESLKKYIGHTSKFSMGLDIADVNNDQTFDILVLDMLPEDERVLKASQGYESSNLSQLKHSLGYHPQYSRNTLQLNIRGNYFTETGFHAGISSTDWSWGAVFADLNLDGNNDVFVTTGILNRPNDLDYISYISNEHIKQKLQNTRLIDSDVLNYMPDGKVKNYVFEGDGKGVFNNKSNVWMRPDSTYSNGLAYADLDLDGDIDIVTNNINQKAGIYQNTMENFEPKFLKISFRGYGSNSFGIGTIAKLYSNKSIQTKQLQIHRGFQSSSEPILHFGLKNVNKIDSLEIWWDSGTVQTIKDIKMNTHMKISYDYNNLKKTTLKPKQVNKKPLEKISPLFDWKHNENDYSDFDREKLIPYRTSQRGPALAYGKLKDSSQFVLFLGNSKLSYSKLITFKNKKAISQIFTESLYSEDVDAQFIDVDRDNDLDLYVVSGNGEFRSNEDDLQDRLYKNENESFILDNSLLPKWNANGSVVRAQDFDLDGDIDLFIGSYVDKRNFGVIPDSYLLENDGSGCFSFSNTKAFEKLGMITDALWDDIDKDGRLDLVVVGEWMPPTVLYNKEEGFIKENLTEDFGLWQTIYPIDIDKDGDLDFLLGNWGTNSKFQTADTLPIKLYFGDFDNNNIPESIVTLIKQGKEYLIYSKDELSAQMSTFINKKYTSYKSFAGETVQDIFGENKLSNSNNYKINNLRSGILIQDYGKFRFEKFTNHFQLAPIKCFLPLENDGDNNSFLVVGNFFGVSPYHGNLDALSGDVLTITKDSNFVNTENYSSMNWNQKEIRKILSLNYQKEKLFLIAEIDKQIDFYKKTR